MTHEAVSIGLYVVFGVVMLPVYAMLLGWFLSDPQELKRPVIALGWVVGLIVLVVVGALALSLVAGALMPA